MGLILGRGLDHYAATRSPPQRASWPGLFGGSSAQSHRIQDLRVRNLPRLVDRSFSDDQPARSAAKRRLRQHGVHEWAEFMSFVQDQIVVGNRMACEEMLIMPFRGVLIIMRVRLGRIGMVFKARSVTMSLLVAGHKQKTTRGYRQRGQTALELTSTFSGIPKDLDLLYGLKRGLSYNP